MNDAANSGGAYCYSQDDARGGDHDAEIKVHDDLCQPTNATCIAVIGGKSWMPTCVGMTGQAFDQ